MPEVKEGAITRDTKRNLIDGIRTKPLAQAAVEAVSRQAVALIEAVAARYDEAIARGEVGADGSGVASETPPIGGRGSTGLLFGRVQSGKTAAMTLAAAVAFDNGFRVVVVVTANNVALVRQTAERLKALAGPRVLSTIKDPTGYEWEGQEANLKQDMREDGLVIVCAKESRHVPSVVRLLRALEAATVPALIFDDEADAATPDTTLAARAARRPKAPQFESAMYRNIVENTAPGQEGESLRETLPHHIFVQVTATPYALLLQQADAEIRPSFVRLLEPGEGYQGGAYFFGEFDPAAQPPAPPIVLVPATEAQALLAARNEPPAGLASSCEFFVLAGAAHAFSRGGKFPAKGYKHLSHTNVRIDQHQLVSNLITLHDRSLRDALRVPDSAETLTLFDSAYQQLRLTLGVETPPLTELLRIASVAIRQREIIRVNAETEEPTYGPTYNFVVGGNILGRGLTIDDLLVTYYVREAVTPQMDTVWQHARMYGYRESLRGYMRVYLPSRLAVFFRQTFESEEELRAVLADADDAAPIPILTPSRGRPTRPGVLDAGMLRIYRGQVVQIVPFLVTLEPAQVGTSAAEILRILQANDVPLDATATRESRFTEVPLQVVRQLATTIPIREDDDGRWDTDAVLALLDATEGRYGPTAFLYARSFAPGDDPNRRRPRGVLSGDEVTMARQKGKYVLALTCVGPTTSPSAWYPTLVVPPDLPPHVFNPF